MKGKFLNNDKKMSSIDESALIVGASLSGLMTGIALAREGVRVTIIEKAGKNRPAGGGLQVDAGTFEQSKTARLLRKLASGGKKSIQLWSSIESRLHKEAEADPRIDLYYDTRVQTVNQDDDEAWIVTDQDEVFYGDILIGADGHRSLVRRYVTPQKPDATFAGYMVWIAAVDEEDIPEEQLPSFDGPEVTMLDGGIDGFLFGSIMDRGENASDKGSRRIGCTWYDNSRNDLLRQLGSVEGSVVKYSIHGTDIPETTRKELADQASVKWPKPWSSVTVRALEIGDITGIPIKEYPPVNLAKGRMALVGDAAHVPAPITASGFNESLKDAAVLGKCVAKGLQGDAATSALSAYESLRLRKVRQMVQSGQSFSQSFGRP